MVLQATLLCLLLIDISLVLYLETKEIDINDPYFDLQKSYGIRGFSVIKITVGLILLLNLNKPTFAQYGVGVTVLGYGYFVLTLLYHFIKRQARKKD